MFRRKKPKKPDEWHGKPAGPKPSLRPESLEDRILLSGTWVDADTGEAIAGPTDGPDAYTGRELGDIAEAAGGDDLLFGNGGDDFLDGGAGDDLLSGGEGNDVLAGGAGDDVLAGGEGDDLIVGGEGVDTVTYADASGAVSVDLGGEVASGEGTDSIIDVENIVGSRFADTLTGDGDANAIDGGAGHDTIDGAGGADTLTGGSGNDTLRGGAGSDTLEGGSGHDTIESGDGDDLIIAGSGNDDIDGGAGFDTLNYSSASGSVHVDLANQTATGLGSDTVRNVERVIGGSSEDTLTGDEHGNELIGGAGADVLSGNAGDDALDGGEGGDTLTGGAGSDTLVGGAGDDVLVADELDTIEGGEGHDSVTFAQAGGPVAFDASVAEVENVTGSAHNDTFSFSAAEAGDVYTVDGGGGYNVLDLSAYDASVIEIDAQAGVATVQLGSGGSFEVHFQNIGHVTSGGIDQPTLRIDPVVADESAPVQIHAIALSNSTEPLTFSWTQVSGPAVTLSEGGTASPSFQPPELSTGSTMRFQVEVSDGVSTTVERLTIGIAAENDPVVVDAGPGQIAAEGDQVTLGATAVDPEGKPIVLQWTQVGGPDVQLSGADTAAPTFVAPDLAEDTVLTFEVSASDGEHTATSLVTVLVQASDDAALVNAGPDMAVEEGNAVQLVATANDPEGQPLTYSWTQTGGPAVVLSGGDSATPTFVAPEGVSNTTLHFQVTVSDGTNVSTDTVTVTVEADDDRPRITSAPNLSVGEKEVTQLSAQAIDPEGQGLQYSWRQVGGPSVDLVNASSPTASFTSPEGISNTYLTFEIAVTDGTSTAIDTVDVLVNADNDAPEVSIAATTSIDAGTTGALSASGTDPEGKALAYTWTQVGGPNASLSNANSADAAFRAPDVSEPTVLTFQVAVTDGSTTTLQTVDITVEPIPAEPGGGEGGGSEGGDDGATADPGGGDPGPSGPLPLRVEAPAMLDAAEGSTVTLGVDVPQSTGAVSYSWSQAAGSQAITLDTTDVANPTFTVPEHLDNEIYLFDVTVTDDTGEQTVQVAVRVEADNDGPSIDGVGDPSEVMAGVHRMSAEASDPEGQNLSYRWVQVGGPSVQLFESDKASLLFSTSQLQEAAEVTFELQVSDGTSVATELVTFIAQPGNEGPEVFAGNDQHVAEGDTVTLHPVASDPNDDALTYHWVQTGGPPVVLSDPHAASPTFDAPDLPADAELTFELTVSDGALEATDSVSVFVAATNDPPTVDAGPFQSVNEGDTVVLGAVGSDSDSPSLAYQWTQVAGPAVSLDGASTANASFQAPEDLTNTYLTFEVSASDGEHTVIDRVMILVNADNDAPTIDAGADFAAPENSTVQLSATASDPEGQELTHTWVQTGGPTVQLSDANALSPAFEAPNVATDTELTIQLTTTDGQHTVVDTVTVTITGHNDAPVPTNATTTATEDTPAPVLLSGVDPDLGDAVESVRIDVLPGVGTLSLHGVPVTAGDSISIADIEAGALTFEPPTDWNGTTDLRFSVFDGDAWSGTPDTSGTQFITVVAQADAPVVSTAPASGTEDSPIALSVSIALGDTDGSETITAVRVTGAPAGSVFTDGVTTVTAWDGSADLTTLDLSTLSMVPGADHDHDFTLTFSATSTEADGGSQSVGAATLDVHVVGVNDPPLPQDTTITIDEDTTAVVDLHALEVDTGDTIQTYRIETLPASGTLLLDGAPVHAGQDISATDVLAGRLTFHPQADAHGSASFEFSVSDGQVWSAGTGTFTIDVTGVADAPTVTIPDVYMNEDGTASLDITFALNDTDGSESITAVRLSGAPVGTIFSDGVNSAMNVGSPIDVTDWDLDALTISPAANYDRDFDLTVSVTSTEADSGHSTTTDGVAAIHVTALNDAPVVRAGSISIAEDTPAPISLGAVDVDTGDAIEHFRIESLPANGTLSLDGHAVTAGQVIDAADVASGALTYTPETNWSGQAIFTFSASDGQAWSEHGGQFTIDVDARADAADLSVSDASGVEDTAVPLDISAALTDTDGSETLSVTISGVPAGASLSAGVDQGGGVWTLEPSDLDGLMVTPPADSDADFTLTVQATTAEASGHTATTSADIEVSIEARADAPLLAVNDATGMEDSAIALDIASTLTDTDGSETLSITVSGVPHGATLSAGVDQGGGVWALSPGDLDGLTITPPTDADADFTLAVTATSTESTGQTSSTTSNVRVTVEAQADAPTLNVADAAGTEDAAIALDIGSSLTDTDGSESLSITISGVPAGATLSAGIDQGGGVWSLRPEDLEGLSITPPANADADFTLTITATATESSGQSSSTTSELRVAVEAQADAPTLSVAEATGAEDAAIALDIAAALTDIDGSESLSITIAGVPEGASLSAGADQGGGVWLLQPGDLDGLTITPPEHASDDFTLSVTAISQESDGSTSASTSDLRVSVAAVADGVGLSVADAAGLEDTGIPIDITATLRDADGSETLHITVSGVPDGASLSAGVDQGGGVWALRPGDLEGLRFTPPEDAAGDFELTLAATTLDDGDTHTDSSTVRISVASVADAPTLVVADASGGEDNTIALDVAAALSDNDGSETLSVTISGVPAGASLSAGNDQGGGVWTLQPSELGELSITPPADSDADFTLTVTATSTEADGSTAIQSAQVRVVVEALADGPVLSTSNASGFEDEPIALDIASTLADTDGSEALAIAISGVPEGDELSAGQDMGGGTWMLQPADLDGLTITPPEHASDDFTLTVTATATEASGDEAIATSEIHVAVTARADVPTLSVADATGAEDSPIALDIDAALADMDGSESLAITISGVPEGATLNAGEDRGDGVWELQPSDLDGLAITPPTNSDAGFTILVTATVQDADGQPVSISQPLHIEIEATADRAQLAVSDASGTLGQPISLNIDAALADTDGSERLTITIAGVPEGATLSAGTDQGGGVWTLSPEDLDGLSVTSMQQEGSFTISVTATSVEQNGDEASVTRTLELRIDPIPVPIQAEEDEPTQATPTNTGTDVSTPQPRALPAQGDGFEWADDAVEQLEQLQTEVEAITLDATSMDGPAPLPQLGILQTMTSEQVATEPSTLAAPGTPLFTLGELQASSSAEPPASDASPSTGFEQSPDAVNADPHQAEGPSHRASMFGLLLAMVRSIGPNKQSDDRK